MKKFVIANWKMNPADLSQAVVLASKLKEEKVSTFENTRVVICPPDIFFEATKIATGDGFFWGGQNIYPDNNRAFTGETSPSMLKSLGAEFVIIGHSERREMGENSHLLLHKIVFALENGLTPIYCIGEKEDDFELAKKTIMTQIDNELGKIDPLVWSSIIVAYEPVWAIGSSAKRQASVAECARMIQFIKSYLSEKKGKAMAVLYGGSVDENNAFDFVNDGLADGILVGRASLNAEKFFSIIKQVNKADI